MTENERGERLYIPSPDKTEEYEQAANISELIRYDMLRYERKLELQEELL